MLLVANLDFEIGLAAGQDRPRRTLGKPAVEAAIRAGSLLRALASDGDTVWLPGSPDRILFPPVPGLPAVEYIHGSLPGAWNGPVLAWGETTATAALGSGISRDRDSGSPVLDALLSAPRPDPGAARQANSKLLLEPLRAGLSCSLPGSGLASSEEDLRLLIEGANRMYGPAAGWVSKAEFSAAGRERVVQAAGTASGAVLAAAARLLGRHGVCLFEPWLARTGDYGCSLIVEPGRVRLATVHRLLVSSRGRFQGVDTVLHGIKEPEAVHPDRFGQYLAPDDAVRMAQAAVGTAENLSRSGYRGPLGIDFWRYRHPEGGERINLLGEVNARWTFGMVAGVLAQRVGAVLGSEPGSPFRLWFGPQPRMTTGRRFPLVTEGAGAGPAITLSIP